MFNNILNFLFTIINYHFKNIYLGTLYLIICKKLAITVHIIYHEYSSHIFLYVYRRYFERFSFELILLNWHIRCFNKRLIVINNFMSVWLSRKLIEVFKLGDMSIFVIVFLIPDVLVILKL